MAHLGLVLEAILETQNINTAGKSVCVVAEVRRVCVTMADANINAPEVPIAAASPPTRSDEQSCLVTNGSQWEKVIVSWMWKELKPIPYSR
ncbi:hypothetical protein Tco_0316741 [Tanacetum coccineum]